MPQHVVQQAAVAEIVDLSLRVQARELEAMGYRIGIYPSQTHRAAIAAAKRVLAVLKRDGDTAAIESELATFSDREEAVNSKRWRELETKYLKEV